ncbi:unnamed protein product [Cochlearia groenlandica]
METCDSFINHKVPPEIDEERARSVYFYEVFSYPIHPKTAGKTDLRSNPFQEREDDIISPTLSFDEKDHVPDLVPEERITRSKAKEMAKRSSHYDKIIVPGTEYQGTEAPSTENPKASDGKLNKAQPMKKNQVGTTK